MARPVALLFFRHVVIMWLVHAPDDGHPRCVHSGVIVSRAALNVSRICCMFTKGTSVCRRPCWTVSRMAGLISARTASPTHSPVLALRPPVVQRSGWLGVQSALPGGPRERGGAAPLHVAVGISAHVERLSASWSLQRFCPMARCALPIGLTASALGRSTHFP